MAQENLMNKYRLDDESRQLRDLERRGNRCIDAEREARERLFRFPRTCLYVSNATTTGNNADFEAEMAEKSNKDVNKNSVLPCDSAGKVS